MACCILFAWLVGRIVRLFRSDDEATAPAPAAARPGPTGTHSPDLTAQPAQLRVA